MKAHLPYIFFVDHRTGSGDTRRRPQVGTQDCEIADVTIGETEVVAAWGWMQHGHTRARSRDAACIRWNGDLYVPVTDESHLGYLKSAPVSGNERAVGRFAVDMFLSMYRGIASSEHRIGHLRDYLEGMESKFARPKTDRVVASTEDADLATVTGMAAGLLVADNRIWQRAVGLHLRVKEVGAQRNRERTELQFDYSKDGGRTWAEDYWWNEHRHVCIHRASLNDLPYVAALTTQVQVPSFFELEIHDGPALAFDGRGDYLGRAVGELVAMAAAEVGGLDHTEVERWLGARQEALNLLVDDSADISAALTALASSSRNPVLHNAVAQALRSLSVFDAMESRKAPDPAIATGRLVP